jgi:pilus assembly protein CpaB
MRRALGIVVAVTIAVLGTLLLVGYVRGAEDRALAGEELVEVLVVEQPIAEGTPSAALGERTVRTELVPLKVRAEGAVSDVAELADLVASVDLLPGEQLVVSRFVTPEELEDGVEAPPDALEVTVAVSPERALGGQLEPGDTVAVVASFDPFDLNAVEPTELAPGAVIDPNEIFVGTSGVADVSLPRAPASTGLILHDILVTNVQLEQLPRTDLDDLPEDGPALAPTGNLLITLAGPPEAVARIVFTAEHGFLWFAAEGELAPDGPTAIQTRRTVYR